MTKNNSYHNYNRSADSTILGFEYQFLLTIKEILEAIQKKASTTFTIEGIEDLDIYSISTKLHQYKYYKKTNVSFSSIQEPIAYMFCHWKKSTNQNITYRLFVHSNHYNFQNLTFDNVMYILALTQARGILNNESILLNVNEVRQFFNSFEFVFSASFEEEKKNVVELISSNLHKSFTESDTFYYPLIIEYIHSIAIATTPKGRTISLNDFLKHIQKIDTIMNSNYSSLSSNENIIVKAFVKQMKDIKYSDKHTYSYVLRFGKNWEKRIDALLIQNIALQFSYKGNRTTNRPVTFLFDFDTKNINILKKGLLRLQKNNLLIMNDGFESISFNKKIFSLEPIYYRNNTKYTDISFNYRIALCKNGDSTLENIDPFFLNFDINSPKTKNSVSFNGFQPNFISKIMKGLSK